MRLRIATCQTLPEPDVDEAPLLAALAARGIDARTTPWEATGDAWDQPIPTVIRSTWNYFHQLAEFHAWAERAAAAAPMWNPADVVRWNSHKLYLRDLAERRLAVVPTAFFTRGAHVDLAAELVLRAFGDIVIKPAVSAGSFATRRFGVDPAARAAAQTFLDELLGERDAMVQAYVPSVESYGERSLVWIDGAFTHAVRKSPRFSGQDESVSEALPIRADERELAEAVLAPWLDRLLYARVDVAQDEREQPMVMELELIEPSLFLVQHPPALTRLVEAIARRLA